MHPVVRADTRDIEKVALNHPVIALVEADRMSAGLTPERQPALPCDLRRRRQNGGTDAGALPGGIDRHRTKLKAAVCRNQ